MENNRLDRMTLKRQEGRGFIHGVSLYKYANIKNLTMRILAITLFSTLLFISCSTNEADKIMHNAKTNKLTILSDNKYVFEISIDSTSAPDKLVAWAAGIYTLHGDTLYITMPADSTSEFKAIKNKYFYADTTQQPNSLNLSRSASRLVDSLFHEKCINCGEMISYFMDAKAIVLKDKIFFLPN